MATTDITSPKFDEVGKRARVEDEIFKVINEDVGQQIWERSFHGEAVGKFVV